MGSAAANWHSIQMEVFIVAPGEGRGEGGTQQQFGGRGLNETLALFTTKAYEISENCVVERGGERQMG